MIKRIQLGGSLKPHYLLFFSCSKFFTLVVQVTELMEQNTRMQQMVVEVKQENGFETESPESTSKESKKDFGTMPDGWRRRVCG